MFILIKTPTNAKIYFLLTIYSYILASWMVEFYWSASLDSAVFLWAILILSIGLCLSHWWRAPRRLYYRNMFTSCDGGVFRFLTPNLAVVSTRGIEARSGHGNHRNPRKIGWWGGSRVQTAKHRFWSEKKNQNRRQTRSLCSKYICFIVRGPTGKLYS